MKFTAAFAFTAAGLALGIAGAPAQAQTASFTEGFNSATLPADWITTNLSTKSATGRVWDTRTQIGFDPDPVNPYEGAGFAVASYQSIGSGVGTINNWLISPVITGLRNGATFSFYTTTLPDSTFIDHLELRLSTAGASVNVGATDTSVGDFTGTLASVNSDFTPTGYPHGWTLVTATVSGLSGAMDGRVAFRYAVIGAGPLGFNSNIIGVDEFSYAAAAPVPEPASWCLMALGLAGLGGVTVRRQSRGRDRQATQV